MKTIKSKTVLFITGAFVSNSGWDEWKTYFENKGYNTVAPAWPHKEGVAKDLRVNQPNPGIASIRLRQLVDHYAAIAKSLPEKPVIIGHSLGGLITQILVNKGLAAAGIAIHSIAPKGVIPTQFSLYKSLYKAAGLFTNTKEAYLMSFEDWQYVFTNGMPLADQRKAYEENTIPESKMLVREGLSSDAAVDFSKPHVPLLFTAGDEDHCTPAGLNESNFKRYIKNGSVTEYKLFKGRNHFVLGQPTWREDADYILSWIDRN
jgi:pimeloyl-ACP methyl ester carboxylesterase